MTTEHVTREKLAADLKQVVADAEDLLKATAGQTGEKVQQVRAKVEESLKQARERMIKVEHLALDRAKEAAKTTDAWVHHNPWQAIGIGAAAGFVIGWLMNHRHP